MGKLKRFFSVVLIAPMVMCLSSCKSDDTEFTGFIPKLQTDTEATINVVGEYSNFESLEEEFERFYEYYPHVSLRYTHLDDYQNSVVNALAGEEAPDIYVTGSWMLDDEKYASVFESAEVLSDKSLELDLSCLRPEIINKTGSGEIVMLPIFTSSYGMLVNMDIFKEQNLSVPETYSELMDTCEKLKAAGYDSPIMGADTTTVSGIFYSFAYPMFSDNVIKNSDRVEALNSMDPSAGELLRPSLTRLQDLIDSGYIDIEKCSREIEDDYNSVILRFFEGDVPIMIGSGNMVSGTAKRESQSEAFTANPFEYKFFVAPAGDDGGYFLNSVVLFFSVNKNSANLDMTNEFIRFLCSEKELGNMAERKRMIPPTDDFTLDEVYSSLADVPADHRFSFNQTGTNDQVTKEFREAAYRVGNGMMTVDEAVSAFGSLGQ